MAMREKLLPLETKAKMTYFIARKEKISKQLNEFICMCDNGDCLLKSCQQMLHL